MGATSINPDGCTFSLGSRLFSRSCRCETGFRAVRPQKRRFMAQHVLRLGNPARGRAGRCRAQPVLWRRVIGHSRPPKKENACQFGSIIVGILFLARRLAPSSRQPLPLRFRRAEVSRVWFYRDGGPYDGVGTPVSADERGDRRVCRSRTVPSIVMWRPASTTSRSTATGATSTNLDACTSSLGSRRVSRSWRCETGSPAAAAGEGGYQRDTFYVWEIAARSGAGRCCAQPGLWRRMIGRSRQSNPERRKRMSIRAIVVGILSLAATACSQLPPTASVSGSADPGRRGPCLVLP